MTLRSMTGYGAGAAAVAGRELQVELRAVNHRFLDTRARLPGPLSGLASVLEDLLKRRCERGRVEAYVSYVGPSAEAPINLARAEAALTALTALRDRVCPGEPLPSALLAGMPGLFAEPESVDLEAARDALLRAAEGACDALDASRRTEGAELARDLSGLMAHVEDLLTLIDAERPAVVAAYEARLRERLQRVIEDAALSLDPARLAMEVAIFADRSDVAEEIARLRAHVLHFRATLAAPGAVGRKLDFLTQELFREANTLGTKTPDVTITHHVVELKSTLERIREQVQNAL